MYLDDVDREISNLTRTFSYISTIILLLVILLSLLQNEQNWNFVISTKGRNLNKYIAI